MVTFDIKQLEDNRILPETTAKKHDVPAFRGIEYLEYRTELRVLRRQLLSLQEWAADAGQRVAIVLEGRDAAGKGSVAATITHYLNPRTSGIVSQGIPTAQEMRNWLGHHYKLMPQPGEMIVYDRSWYSRALIQPAMGYCTMRQYHYFMSKVNDWERDLVDEGVTFIKLYLSVSPENPRTCASASAGTATCNTGNIRPTTARWPSGGSCSPTSRSACSPLLPPTTPPG